MTKIHKWLITAAAFGCAAACVVALAPLADKDEQPKAAASTQPEQKLEPGQIRLKPEEIEHLGLKSEPIAASTFAPDIRLFGITQEDPDASFAIRAQVAGLVKTIEGKPWPEIAQTIADNTTVGTVEPRPIPADQIALASQQATLQTQLATAQADFNTANFSLKAAQTAYERLKALNEQDKNVSDRVVQEAQLKVQTEQVHLQGAQNTLKLAGDALKSLKSTLAPVPLVISKGGEVVEMTAHPNESVEPGAPILRVSRFNTVIAQVFVPASESVPATAKEAKITPYGSAGNPLNAVRIGNGPTRDPKTKEAVLMFRVTVDDPTQHVRPGTPVIASIPAEGEPLQGVTIPRAAVVRYLGKAWVYIVGENNIYQRREVSLDHPLSDGSGWFVNQGFKTGEQVVTTGAASMLSDEVNAMFGGGGD